MLAEDAPPYRGVEVRGEAIFSDAPAVPVMQRLAERYLSGHDVDGYLKRMREWIDQTVVVRLEPGVLRAWDYADEEW